MFRLILGVIVTIVLFVVLGMGTEGEGYHEHLVWKLKKKQLLALIPLVIFILLGCVSSVPANHVGIVYSPFGGTKEQTLDEGFTLKSPLDKIYVINTEIQTSKIKDLTTQTKDAQYVISKLNVKYKVNEDNAFKVFKQYRTLENMSESLIRPTTQRVLEHITTKYNVIDILGEERNTIYSELEVALAEELAEYGVEFDSISITDMDAGAKLEAAIEAEAVAKKDVETAEQELKKAEMDTKKEIVEAKAKQEAAKVKAETKIINAEATKKSNELLEKSLTDKILQQQWIEKWNGKLPTYYGSDGNLMIGVGGTK